MNKNKESILNSEIIPNKENHENDEAFEELSKEEKKEIIDGGVNEINEIQEEENEEKVQNLVKSEILDDDIKKRMENLIIDK